MKFHIFPTAAALAVLSAFGPLATAEERTLTPEQMEALAKQGDLADEDQPARPAKLPDLTKGEEISPGKVAPQLWYLGPTGITGFMVGGFPGDQIQVQSTFKGSPADGKFLSGDVIIGMNGKKFTAGGHLGQLIGYAIIEAEKADNKGKISFLVWRDKNFNARHGKKGVNSVDVDKLFAQIQGDNSLFDWKPEQERKAEVKKMAFDEFPIIPTTLEIGLTLRVMPAYSDTAPYDCPKTKQILEDAWKVLEARFAPNPKTGKPGAGGSLEALALVASGKPEHRKLVHDWVRSESCREWQPPKEKGPITLVGRGYASWHAGFGPLNCALYYDATGDDYVVPALRKYAVETAMGQSGGGSWGHTFAFPSFNGGKLHGMNPGYGALNAAGNRCFMLVTLAKKLGIEDPEIDAAIVRARRFFGSYVDQGGIPYGDHPAADTDDSNGKNTGVAFSMKLLGDNYSAKYFAMMSTHASFTARGGHGHDYTGNWSAWAASLCGPEVRALAERNMRWRRTLCRLHDGSFVYISPTGKYGTLQDPTATEVLHQSAPFKQTLISGKDADESLWPTKREVGQLLASAQLQFNDPWLDAKVGTPWQKRSTDEIFDLLDIFKPKMRGLVAQELAKRFQAGEKDIAPRLVKLLENEEPRFRDGGLRGLLACGKDTVLENLSKVTKLLEDPKDFVRITAVNVIAQSTETEETQLAMLKATVADPQAAPPNSIRNAAQAPLFAKDSKLANSPFEAGFDEKLVQDALEKLITLDPVGNGRGFVSSRKAVWSKDTVIRLAGPLTFAAEEEQIMDQMFAARSAPARALLEKFGYREALLSSAHQLRLKAALPRDVRPTAGFKRAMIDPEAVRKQPAAFRELIEAMQIVLTDDPLTVITRTTASLDELRALVEADKSQIKLPSIADDARAMFQQKLDASDGSGAKLKLCRTELKDPARKNYFTMMAAMDFLATTLGSDAIGDLTPYLGHEHWRLRDHSRKLAAELAAGGGDTLLADLFGRTSSPAAAAGILDVFAAAKAKTGLTVARKAMKHEDPLVRQAAVKATFALGGDAALTEVLAHLKQATTPEDLRGCEDALLARRADPAHAARARDAVIAMLPDASAPVLPTLYWLLAQIGDPTSLAALAKLARTDKPAMMLTEKVLTEIVFALSYSPSREADKLLLDIAASGKTAAGIAGAQAVRRMVIGPKGYGDVPLAARMDFAEAMLNHVLDGNLISYLGRIHEPRALAILVSCLRKGADAAGSLISSAEGMQKLSPADAEIAAKALQDVIEYIEVTRLRGGPQAHMAREDNYVGWKALQARAGKALLKFHKPGAAPIPTFDPLELDR
jgi:hypothetical protein